MNKCLTINTLCNWNCKYCIAETNREMIKKRPPEETIFLEAKKFLENVNPDDYSSITLSGGEPGLLPTDKMVELLEVCKKRNLKIDFNSNGKIFAKLIYIHNNIDNTLLDCVQTIDWHLSENFNELFVDQQYRLISPYLIPLPDKYSKNIDHNIINNTINNTIEAFKNNYDIEVRPLVVLTEKDINPMLQDYIYEFKGLNSKLEVRICEPNESGSNIDLVLTNINKLKMLNYFNHTDIISEESGKILEQIINKEKRNVY